MGVRVDDARALAALRAGLRNHLVDEAVDAVYSVRVGIDAHGPAQAFALLYRGAQPMVRTRSRVRVLRALAAYLASHDEARAPGRIAGALGIVTPQQRAVIVPRPGDVSAFDRHLARTGRRIVDGPSVVVDPWSATLVVPEPLFDVDAVLGEFDQRDDPPDDAAAPLGSYPIAVWAVPDLEPAAVLAHVASRIAWRDHDDVLAHSRTLADAITFVLDDASAPATRARWISELAG